MKIINAPLSSLMDLKEFCIEVDDLEVAVDFYLEPPELESLPSKPCVLAETTGDITRIAEKCEVGIISKDLGDRIQILIFQMFAFLPIGFALRILYLAEELPITTAWKQLSDELLADIKYTDGM